MLIQVQTAVQLTYPYRTSLAPQPPFCWQSPDRALTSTARRVSGGTLLAGLHTTPLPGSHANLGYCQSHGRSRHPIPQGSRRDKVGQSFRSWFTSGERSKPSDKEFPYRNRPELVASIQQSDPLGSASRRLRDQNGLFSRSGRATSKLAVHPPDSWALRPWKSPMFQREILVECRHRDDASRGRTKRHVSH